MRAAVLGCLIALASATVRSQSNAPPLVYKGWALGITLDSARRLSSMQLGRELACVGGHDKTLFCQTSGGPAYASLYFRPAPRHVEELYVQFPLDAQASKDSIASGFTSLWGSPAAAGPGKPVGTPGVAMEILGHWTRDGMIAASASIAGGTTARRTLSVMMFSPARRLRLIRERAESSKAK